MHMKCWIHIFFIQWLRAISSWALHMDSDEMLTAKIPDYIPVKGPLIIDTDAGIDDAMAIFMLLNFKGYDVKAITCVRGNTNVFNVAINVQKVLNVANRSDIPLYVGADFGLIHTEPITGLFGQDGFADLDESGIIMTNLGKGHAAVTMAKLVTENPGKMNILCLGPLTNLALSCHLQPQFLRLANTVFVFGGTFGICAVSPRVESNFYMDPEAAQLVLKRASALNRQITILPMDIATELSFDKQIRKFVFGTIRSPEMVFLNRAYDRLDLIYSMKNKFHSDDKMIAGDFYTAAIMINPMALRDSNPYYVEVDTHGNKSRSVTIIDFANLTKKQPNANMIFFANRILLDKTILAFIR